MPEPDDAKRRLSAKTRARLGWWLPPLLGLLAVGFQYAFDVPKAEMLQSPSAEEKKAHKAKKRAALRKKNRERRRAAQRWTGRSGEELASLRREWLTRPIEQEPRDQGFRRHHEAVLRSAVTHARAKALGDAEPPAIQIRPACHTIRCTLELCGPQQLVDDIGALLPEIEVEPKLAPVGPLFLELREVGLGEDTRARRRYHCRRWLLSFDRDNVQIRDLRLE